MIFANIGSATSGTIQTSLTVSSIGTVDNISSTSSAVAGQTMTLGGGASLTTTIVSSSTTPSQYIASGQSGAQNASQATFNFISNGGVSTITEMKFSTVNNAVTNICVGNVCAQPVSGVADLAGLNLSVPNGGGGLTQSRRYIRSSWNWWINTRYNFGSISLLC